VLQCETAARLWTQGTPWRGGRQPSEPPLTVRLASPAEAAAIAAVGRVRARLGASGVASVWLDGRDSRCGRSDTRIQHEIEIGGRSSARMERDEEVVKSFLEKQILEPLQIASASGSA
jgi:hypothetical protein